MKKLLLFVLLITLNVTAQKKIRVEKHQNDEFLLELNEYRALGDGVEEAAIKKIEKRLSKGGFTNVSIGKLGYVITNYTVSAKMSRTFLGSADKNNNLQSIDGYVSQRLHEDTLENDGGSKARQVEFIDNETGTFYKVRLSTFWGVKYIIARN